jgi:DNA-binding MarR family transcriptional regulator
MRDLKFSGREASVVRAIDFATGTIGAEILVKTRLDAQDALDILNALLDAGFIETNPPSNDHIELKAFYHTIFEANPAYIHQMRKSLIRP